MQTFLNKGILTVATGTYRLDFPTDRPFVDLYDAQGQRAAQLFAYASVNTTTGQDDTVEVEPWQVSETEDGGVTVFTRACSSVWERKEVAFVCREGGFGYQVTVEGQGDLLDVHLMGGYYSAQLRWGSGFFGSGQSFLQGFTPEPNTEESSYFQAGESSTIDLTGVPLPGKGGWFFTPPPFCFAFQVPSGWIGLGVEAQPGQFQFGEYRYQGRRGGFSLALSFDGQTRVVGELRLPGIGFTFGVNEFDVLEQHVEAVRERIGAAAHPVQAKPAWWSEPIFCGWGSQCYLAALEEGRAGDYSRQPIYTEFLKTLAQERLDPGILVLDDKWQLTYGNNEVDEKKWPDLSGFIRQQHEQGRKVLLWLKAWDPEGVPLEECIRNSAGKAVAIDPSHPQYEARLRASVRRMLSDTHGYGADGFKIDFTARIPSGPGLVCHGKVWGLELLKRYLGILYDEAKRTKPEALVMTHTPHPYLSDVVDMIRLNDINVDHDVNRAMSLRARVAHIACPDAIIDTDNWPIKNKSDWRRYLSLQPDLGVPSLYFATHIDSTREALTESDYGLVREVWARHRAKRNVG